MSRARHKKATGGAVNKPKAYNAKGTPALEEGEDKTDKFAKGGRTLKRGGRAMGKKPMKRMDRPSRRADGGRSPFTSAATTKGRPGGNYAEKVDASDD